MTLNPASSKIRCCHYCQRTHRKNGEVFKNGRSVEDHERVCLLNPDNMRVDDEDDTADDFVYSPTEIELTDTISIWR